MRALKTYKRSALPDCLIAAVKTAAPDSARRRTWHVTIASDITIRYCYWDSGSMAEYDACCVYTREHVNLPIALTPRGHFSHPDAWIEPTYPIPRSVVVVKHGISCGKNAFPHVHITESLARELGINA